MSGLGGIGKTQIVVEYAYRDRQTYRQVWWASAETMESLNAAYTQIAVALDLAEKGAQEQEVIVAAVKRWLNEHEGWLLILDNVDEPEVLEAFLPPVVGGQVVGFGHALEVETFTTEQGACSCCIAQGSWLWMRVWIKRGWKIDNERWKSVRSWVGCP